MGGTENWHFLPPAPTSLASRRVREDVKLILGGTEGKETVLCLGISPLGLPGCPVVHLWCLLGIPAQAPRGTQACCQAGGNKAHLLLERQVMEVAEMRGGARVGQLEASREGKRERRE